MFVMSLRHLYQRRIRSRPNLVLRNNKYMIQLLVSINMAYITITRSIIKDRPRSLLYMPNSLSHRPRSLAEFTKTGRDNSGRDHRQRFIVTKLDQHVGNMVTVVVMMNMNF